MTIVTLPSPALSTTYPLDIFSPEFQSNSASIRSSAPGVLTGLGIECPQLSATAQDRIFFAPKRRYRSTKSSYGSQSAFCWRPFAPSPLVNSPILCPDSTMMLQQRPTKTAESPDPRTSLPFRLLSAASGLPPDMLTTHISATAEDALPTAEPGRPSKNAESPDARDSLSFRLLSAASGLSPDILASHISATAEIALHLMSNSQPNTPYFGDNAAGCNVVKCKVSCQSQPRSVLTPDMALPIVDINMRHMSLSSQDAIVGINPTDTLPAYAQASSITSLPPQSEHCPTPDASFADIEDNDEDEECYLFDWEQACNDDTRINLEDVGGISPASPMSVNGPEASPSDKLLDVPTKELTACEEREPSLYNSLVLHCQSRSDSCAVTKGNGHALRIIALPPSPAPSYHKLPQDVDLGTPVIDAHLGITLTELQEKAERYRLRNKILLANTGEMECQYDRKWLLSFVGKLTQQGSQIQEYRCYVLGCTQTNKRRDHILIHLGAHLGHRPFKCTVCPARFFRKNESKRHELTHSGVRPFVCEFCLCAFVRQDLLKRHIKRTHPSATMLTKRKHDDESFLKRPGKRTKANGDSTVH